MIDTCHSCGKDYPTKYRDWWHQYLPPVCSAKCFAEWVKSRPVITTMDDIFVHSDRSCRSHGERKLIQALDKLGLPWQYEPLCYTLDDKSRYVPDFLVSCRLLVEFKGIWNTEGKKKFLKLQSILDEDETLVAMDIAFVSMLGRRQSPVC